MDASQSAKSTYRDRDYDQAIQILRDRIFRTSRYSHLDIQKAVQIVKDCNPDHPLLRYSERGPLRPDAAE